jgi:hypothetical protein
MKKNYYVLCLQHMDAVIHPATLRVLPAARKTFRAIPTAIASSGKLVHLYFGPASDHGKASIPFYYE